MMKEHIGCLYFMLGDSPLILGPQLLIHLKQKNKTQKHDKRKIILLMKELQG